MTLSELSAALSARGFIDHELVFETGPEAVFSPWYVQVMLGFCAWLAGILLLLFVVFGLESILFRGHENWGLLFFLGIVGCASAAGLYAIRGGHFADQFALAMSCAGQIAMAAALGGKFGARTSLWGMVLIEIVLTFALRNRLQRLLTSLGAVIAWGLAMHEILFRELPGIAWHRPVDGPYPNSLLSVLLWLLVWAPVACGAYLLVAREAQWMAEGREKLLRPVTHGLIAALSLAPLATHPAAFWVALGLGSSRDLTDGLPGVTALWPLLSAFLALLALALAFALRHRPLMGVAIVFGLLEVSGFYYVLGATLLVKSIIMLALGAALLTSARVMARERT